MCRADLLLDMLRAELLGLGDQLGLRRALELALERLEDRGEVLELALDVLALLLQRHALAAQLRP